MTTDSIMTFEQGYARLQTIASPVTSEEVPVAEMCDLFAEGKGLERSLTDYLNEQKGRVEAIERGEEVQSFSIVAGTEAPAAASTAHDIAPSPAPATDDFTPAGGDTRNDSRPAIPAEDDIPF